MQKSNIQAAFIAGNKGALFALHRAPQSIRDNSECFLVAPSFAEEMNRCRYMCTMFAQQLAQRGHGFLSVDLYGTGDSAGDFSEADWTTWRSDLINGLDYATDLGYKRISLLGIRLGALLAMEILEERDSVHRIILWQPVTKGRTALTQFMRIRIAASLERDEDGGSLKDFERKIDTGEHVQVAGYDVSPALYKSIQGAQIDSGNAYNKVPIAWFNTLASEDRKTPRAETEFLSRWQDSGAKVEHETVIGPSYWAVHERTLAPSLVEATAAHIGGVG